MVFANLGPQEKDAFFSLLDEYFASRPELLAKPTSSHDGQAAAAAVTASSAAAASAVRNAVAKHPEAATKYMSAGLKHLTASGSNHSKDNRPSSSSNSNKGTVTTGSGAGESAEEEPPSMAGRIAAAQAMFSGKNNPFSKHKEQSSSPSPPPPPPSSYGTSTLKSSSFAPPPIRRTASSTPNSRLPPPPATPPPVKEEQGEWVEALYDYDSGEAGDLKVKEGQRILLIERTSDDWWTGELNEKKGLIPASYVKPL